MTVRLHAHDAVLPAGHVLGLVLGQSDTEFTETDDRAPQSRWTWAAAS